MINRRPKRAFVTMHALLLGTASLCACDRAPIYTRVSVSPAELRAALPEVERANSNSSAVRDDTGEMRIVHPGTSVEFPREPPSAAFSTSVKQLATLCGSSDPFRAHCLLDGRTKHPQLLVQTGSYYAPKEALLEEIFGVTALVLVTGGIVALEGECFANCGSDGKVLLVSVDVVAGVVTAGTVLLFVATGHGMSN